MIQNKTVLKYIQNIFFNAEQILNSKYLRSKGGIMYEEESLYSPDHSSSFRINVSTALSIDPKY